MQGLHKLCLQQFPRVTHHHAGCAWDLWCSRLDRRNYCTLASRHCGLGYWQRQWWQNCCSFLSLDGDVGELGRGLGFAWR